MSKPKKDPILTPTLQTASEIAIGVSEFVSPEDWVGATDLEVRLAQSKELKKRAKKMGADCREAFQQIKTYFIITEAKFKKCVIYQNVYWYEDLKDVRKIAYACLNRCNAAYREFNAQCDCVYEESIGTSVDCMMPYMNIYIESMSMKSMYQKIKVLLDDRYDQHVIASSKMISQQVHSKINH